MKIVFAGTPEFAVPSLRAVRDAGHHLLAVYTQPDRPAGRGRHVSSSPVKDFALAQGLQIVQPASLKSDAALAELRSLDPDAMIVVAFGLILPPAALQIPRFGCINVHASLLPRWRGAAPIQRAIEAGDSETGITIMQMDAGLDTGDILETAATDITPAETSQTLHDRLAQLGADTLVRVLERLKTKGAARRPQEQHGACYAPKLSKNEALVSWHQSALVLHRKIRALNPWPVAHTVWNGRILRLWDVAPLADTESRAQAPGTVVAAGHGGVCVQAAGGVLCVTRLQIEGGRPCTADAFLHGHPLAAGAVLGQ